ncbi:MAG: glycoside hydrolase family 88 protein [Clostridiales bacterium]|nr:glycoside hydrolase family 88 protein [Clostridiales bacterium]
MNIHQAREFTIKRVKETLDYFYDCFPSEQSENYIYKKFKNVSWTTGFYEGLLWLAYEWTGNESIFKSAKHHSRLFGKRLDENIELDHHDMGFLFTLSSVADYKITGDETAKKDGIRAADKLMARYRPDVKFIQAWGDMKDPKSCRFIVDCLLNIPLLFWAGEITGDTKYRDAAVNHMNTAVKYIIRPDFSTHHTFFFDPKTKLPLRGETHQGYSDTSAWARGQAWAVYGLALCYAYTRDEGLLEYFDGVTEYFISHLPKNYVPYWDLIFTDGSGEERDTSAAAVAVCGILEMEKHRPRGDFKAAADKMLCALCEAYTTEGMDSNGILKEGMYSKKHGHKSECNTWGDYFFAEALMRAENPEWKKYW